MTRRRARLALYTSMAVTGPAFLIVGATLGGAWAVLLGAAWLANGVAVLLLRCPECNAPIGAIARDEPPMGRIRYFHTPLLTRECRNCGADAF